jgi:hypothetical protein
LGIMTHNMSYSEGIKKGKVGNEERNSRSGLEGRESNTIVSKLPLCLKLLGELFTVIML